MLCCCCLGHVAKRGPGCDLLLRVALQLLGREHRGGHLHECHRENHKHNKNHSHRLCRFECYCINECLVRSCSVSINSCKSEFVKLLQEVTPKVTNSLNSYTYWLGKRMFSTSREINGSRAFTNNVKVSTNLR